MKALKRILLVLLVLIIVLVGGLLAYVNIALPKVSKAHRNVLAGVNTLPIMLLPVLIVTQ